MFFFFFKQKPAYEMLRSLVGSEMCIRDCLETALVVEDGVAERLELLSGGGARLAQEAPAVDPVSYTHLTLLTIDSV